MGKIQIVAFLRKRNVFAYKAAQLDELKVSLFGHRCSDGMDLVSVVGTLGGDTKHSTTHMKINILSINGGEVKREFKTRTFNH